MRRWQYVTVVFVTSCFAFSPMAMAGSLFYNFEQLNSGTVLATLELTSSPATHTEVRGLTFTQAGQAIFGLGPTYLGGFDETNFGAFVDDGSGGLRSGDPIWPANLADRDPPTSSVKPDLADRGLWLEAGADASPYSLPCDAIHLFGIEIDSDTSQIIGIPSLFALGHWRAIVPEPGSLGLAVLAALVGVGVGRRRKRAV
jgi:hypothetical protein